MKQTKSVTVAVILMLSTLIPLRSDAWSLCTIEQRIELGNQGYSTAEVERMCRDARWTESMLGLGFAHERSQLPSSGATSMVGGSETGSPGTSSPNGARFCGTSYGTCPLSGGPTGSPCQCPGWNGYLFTGVSR